MAHARTLRVAPGLRLPLDAVTEVFGIVGRRGSGKTTTARVVAEEMIRAGQQVTVVDPTGVWWGLRSSADGDAEGLPVVVFGGDRADVPLDPDAGEVLARLIADESVNAVVDLSLMRKGEQRRLLTVMFETIYRHNRDPLHLMLDEADLYAPQRPVKGAERLLGAVEDLVRRGRVRGLGMTLITQRPAVISKDVLTQLSTLVAMNVSAPQDRKALDEWVRIHASGDDRDKFLGSLATLKTGEAWVWSPEWLELFKRVSVRAPTTFDSSATPKAGARRAEPTGRRPVDLDEVRRRFAEVIDRAEADDPQALRRQVTELERAVRDANRRADATPAEVEVEVEVPTVDREAVTKLRSDATNAAQAAAAARSQAEAATAAAESLLSGLDALEAAAERSRGARTRRERRPEQPRRDVSSPRSPSPADVPVNGEERNLRAGERRMLAALARPPGVLLTRAQLGTLAGLRHTGGTFSTYLSRLRRAGLIAEQDGLLVITDSGVATVGGDLPDEPRTVEDVLSMWLPNLRGGARRMLRLLVDWYPEAATREQLAEAAGIVPTGGTFSTYLSKLRANGLVEVDGDWVRASDTLFPAA